MNVRNVKHVARTLALYRARRAGWLEGRTLQDLADRLGVNRSTISRNLRDLDHVRGLADEYLGLLAPHIPTKRE
jgi:hypothetical protein